MWHLVSEQDKRTAAAILGVLPGQALPAPDVEIAPDDGQTYLHRWHVIPRNREANVYLHVQTRSDPERPLHDHPWDNHTVILSGGYVEVSQAGPPWGIIAELPRVKGECIGRRAEEAHRLLLPANVPYTMTLFTTGPVRRDWGFWLGSHRGRPEWVSHRDCLVDIEGRSVFKRPEGLR